MRTLAALTLSLFLIHGTVLADTPKDADAPAKPAAPAKPKAAKKAEKANTGLAAEIEELRQAVQAQQEQLQLLKEELAKRDREIDAAREAAATANAKATEATTRATEAADKATQTAVTAAAVKSTAETLTASLNRLNLNTSAEAASVSAASTGASAMGGGGRALMQEEGKKESPLSFRIGGAEFTPGGFLDFTAVYRTAATGNGISTNFFNIPLNSVVAGRESELNLSAENSRISLKATDRFGANDVTGYVESDFHGNDATNLHVSSNSSTFRLRLYWVDVKRDKFEFLAGQSWSFLTPNRVGMSPAPSDIFYSQNMDLNYQVGLTWTRAPQIRFIYHPDGHWGLGVSLENPDLFTGQGSVSFPAAFNAAVGTQVDSATAANRPNTMPDVIPKITYDTNLNGKHFHVEAAGLVNRDRVLLATAGPSSSIVGGGGSIAANLELVHNFRFVANAFVSSGGGRYLFGSGPQFVVRPGGTLALVRADGGIAGFEWQADKRNLFAVYYGADYFGKASYLDTTSPKPNVFIGYGTPGSTVGNRTIQEGTFDWIRTFWKNPQYGALQVITQYSYLTRSPWSPGVAQPKNARNNLIFADIRYVLP